MESMMGSYYGRTIPQQMQGKYTRVAGLNEYNPSHDMNDNLMSDMLDALPYRDTGITLYAEPTTKAPLFTQGINNVGQVLASISDSVATNSEHIVSLTRDDTHIYIVDYDVYTNSFVKVDATASGLLAVLTGFDKFSVCRYATEAASYIVFACDSLQKLIYYDYTTWGEVDLPFYPMQIVPHANRIFSLDDKNTLWWSKAGNPFNIGILDSWYSAITESTVLEDAGYWVVERERIMQDMCVMNESIYIFGRQNIYIFQGTNYDTFQLSLLVSDFGIRGDMYVNHLCVSRNTAYLIDDGDVYEFNGQSAPRIISHAIFVNTGLTNGVLGGFGKTELTHITADSNYVYVYQKWHMPLTPEIVNREYIYMFHINTRTWWKVSGFNDNTSLISNEFTVDLIPSFDRSKTFAVVSDYDETDGGTPDDRYWYIYDVIGTMNTKYPYIVTKAFNNVPSTQETLTAVILQMQAVKDATCDIKAYYSLTTSADDFVEFWHNEDYIFNGDLENVFIPLPVALIANSHHYRLKFEFKGDTVIVYNIERRFRVRGVSR